MSTEQIAHIAILLALNIWIAYRYAFQPLGPDEGIWMLSGWTGARYGRDYVDCKPPGIHVWFWLLAKLTRKSVWASKFLHHITIGLLIVAAYALSGSLGTALLATALLQSGWLRAYQSWMDQVSGALLLLSVLSPPAWALALIGLACLFNVKSAVPGAVWIALNGYWLTLGVGLAIASVVAAAWYFVQPQSFRDVWLSAVDVPSRMNKWRAGIVKLQFSHEAFLIVVPAVVLCFASNHNYKLWATALSYVLFNSWGRVWRANHWLPLSLIVAASPPPLYALVVLLAEWVSVRFYFGNIWAVTYPQIAMQLLEARLIGEKLGAENGALWVNSFHTQIYVYAKKKPEWSCVEQLEIRDVMPERGKMRDEKLRRQPPTWIVLGPGRIDGDPKGFQTVGQIGNFAVLG